MSVPTSCSNTRSKSVAKWYKCVIDKLVKQVIMYMWGSALSLEFQNSNFPKTFKMVASEDGPSTVGLIHAVRKPSLLFVHLKFLRVEIVNPTITNLINLFTYSGEVSRGRSHWRPWRVKFVETLTECLAASEWWLTFSSGRTRNEPPPAASVMIATNFGLTAQYVDSHELLVMRMLS